MKTKTSAMILALFMAGSAEAVKYRPYVDGRTPWYKTSPGAPSTDFPHNYPVPDFGVDHDIKFTKEHMAAAESKLGHVMQASFKAAAPPPQDYFVPNFGEDHEMKYTKKNINDAEGKLGHSLQASFAPPPSHPMDYFVPDFGADHDIKETLKHASAAETGLGHTWAGASAPGHPTDYFVPHFGEDTDIKSTQAHIAAAEAKLGHQLSASYAQPAGPASYPVPDFGTDHDIKDSLAHTKSAEDKFGEWTGATFAKPAEPPRNYFVPDFGMDKDIKDSLSNTAASEGKFGHKLSYLQQGVDLHLESDPICSSAGCTQYKHKKKPLGYKINYPVPNFGVDTDIMDNHASLTLAESMKSHKLILGTDASKEKWHNPAKDVDYNFAPKLDHDIITTNKNLADSETNLGHKWLLA